MHAVVPETVIDAVCIASENVIEIDAFVAIDVAPESGFVLETNGAVVSPVDVVVVVEPPAPPPSPLFEQAARKIKNKPANILPMCNAVFQMLICQYKINSRLNFSIPPMFDFERHHVVLVHVFAIAEYIIAVKRG